MLVLLSWNEIRSRAVAFSKEWEDASNESADAKSFWDAFFYVFGISRKRVASFEQSVKKAGGEQGFVDLLWKGLLLVEHKSRGKDLDKAYDQARDYFPGLKESELPRYIIVSDFEHFVLYDLEEGGERRFTLKQFPDHIELFGFIAGYQKQEIKEQDPVNIEAAEQMGQLHDKLKEIGYDGHELEVFLVRLLFCLFADDTGIFEKDIFKDYIEQETSEDGHDLGLHLSGIFDVLNTPENERMKNLNERLNDFPYVNGKLFEKRIAPASFDSEMKSLLLESSALDWGQISPAVFGSLFQSVMDKEQRRELGAHYTTEENILKVIKPLFMDDLWEEFERLKNMKTQRDKRLEEFHNKLADLKFLDPACGCGNFLIIAYRELRLLEIEVIRELLRGRMLLNIEIWVRLDVDQFYGIEIDDFASQIAQVALWLMDHQMNRQVSEEFGEYLVRLPLTKKPNIVHGNALQLNWESVVAKTELNYILGNPPFGGARTMQKHQKEDLKKVSVDIKKVGALDFVAGWYIKAAEYMRFTNIKGGLVSTNSITQGEQAFVLWKYLMYEKDVEINFAHQTFKWSSEAKGKAGVYCVIIGFSCIKDLPKTIFSYSDVKGEPTVRKVKHINNYLLDAPTIFIEKRTSPICDVPKMLKGSTPIDKGNFLFNKEEMIEFINKEPNSEKYFKEFYGGDELIQGTPRYVLYLKNCPPQELRGMPLVRERVENVREERAKSKRSSTQKLADYPTWFAEDRVIFGSPILAIPEVSSETRDIIPVAFLKEGVVCSNKVFQIEGEDIFYFGLLNSAMHMAWVNVVCGRLESRYSYSNTLVYNNFMFPGMTKKQKENIEIKAKKILEVRSKYKESNLADLYDRIAMPPDLLKAHRELDQSVDKAYGKKFKTDEERVAHLFKLYQEKTNI